MRILSKEEIIEVLEDSKNTKYLQRNVIFGGHKINSIKRISEIHKLILVEGNEDTGFEHILKRHNFLKNAEWKKYRAKNGKTKIKLDNPSRFPLGIVPIFDYLKIADKVYDQNSLRKIEDPEFDVYENVSAYKSKKNISYRLITYKNTKIIHTLFPTTSDFNKEKIKGFNLQQGPSRYSIAPPSEIETYLIPYFAVGYWKKYEVEMKMNPQSRTEKWFLRKLDKEGTVVQNEMIFEKDKLSNTLSGPFRCMELDINAHKEIQQLIKKIENKEND